MCILSIALGEMFGSSLPFRLWKCFADITNGTARGPIEAPKTVYVWPQVKHCSCCRIAKK